MTHGPTFVAAATVLMLSLATAVVARQAQTGGSATARSVWDGVYTEAQASRGRAGYQASCASCHPGDAASGLPEPRFVGERFWAAWGEDSVGRLHVYLRDTMPNDAPGTLSDQVYVDVTAYLLQANGIPTGPTELTGTSASSIHLARRDSDGSIPAGAFVAVVGCLTRAADGAWTITEATEPVRARAVDKGDTVRAASQPPGTGVFRLLYAITPLGKMVGHKVLVRGHLVREPGDAINVLSVQSVSESCQPEE